MAESEPLWCPSSRPDQEGAVVLGVHAEPRRLTYLDAPVPASEVVAGLPEGVDPTRVVRFASLCRTSCSHWQGACTLLEKVAVTPEPSDAPSGGPVPPCHLRSRCRWWDQRGVAACRRCPVVETFVAAGDTLWETVADPSAGPDDVAVGPGPMTAS